MIQSNAIKLPYIIKVFFLCFVLGACGLTTPRPKLEMTYAQMAFMAAREAEADKKSPTLFRKAEFYYLKAKSAYKRKYFNKAKQYAILSKNYSERAEFVAVRKKTLDNLK